jgi:glutamate---cysteine ligase / carboxylate-amine ligase
MMQQFTLGVEEEFQIVERESGQLASRIHALLDKGGALLGEQIKAEMLQSALEVVSNVCPTIGALRLDLREIHALLLQLLEAEDLALISAGTHPMAQWQEQQRTLNERYEVLEKEYQDVGRSILIFGLHVHVGINDYEMSVPLINQLRTWLPHMLALSANSPFWAGRVSGLRSYRSIVWKRFPRSGVPEILPATRDFEYFVEQLVRNGCIDNGKRIWWDIRPHPFFHTIEFRIADMPASFDDTIAMAALSQALVVKLAWLYRHNMTTHVLPALYIEENKWHAARYGLDGQYVDFVRNRRMSMREAIYEMLDFVDDVVDDLGSRHEINHWRALLEDPLGTGADRQLAVYQHTGSLKAVAHFLIEQTMQSARADQVML